MGKQGDLTDTLEKEKEEKNELSMSVTKGTAWGEVVLLLKVPGQSQEVSICSAGFGAMAPR